MEVAIVGAGMVGLTLASLLAKQGRSLAIIDPRKPPAFHLGQEYAMRVTAVSPGSQAIFEHVQAWSAMRNKRVTPYHAMRVWDAAGPAEINFNAADLNLPELGNIVENVVIQSSLWELLRRQNDIVWQLPAVIKKVLLHGDHVEITLHNHAVLTAKLLVGADGYHSSVRKFADLPRRQKPYRQRGIVARVRTQRSHQNTAWQRFLNTGPLALLPLNNDQCAIVWSVNDDYADELLKLSTSGFAQALTQASEGRLGSLSPASGRTSFALVSSQATNVVRPRIALVGDAAHVLHPLAGQGANLGFTDAAVLAEVLAHAQRDVGSYKVLRKYARARTAEVRVMQCAMHTFVAMFAATSGPLVATRNFALHTVDRVQPVKKFFMRRAMGLHRERPAFAR